MTVIHHPTPIALTDTPRQSGLTAQPPLSDLAAPIQKRLRSYRPRKRRPSPARNPAGRALSERLVRLAIELPEPGRSIVVAYFGKALSVLELANLHHCTYRQMRFRINHLQAQLLDPMFLLTVRFARRLPEPLSLLAQAYWIHARTIRELAQAQKKTLHRVRSELAQTRALLLLELAQAQHVPASAAHDRYFSTDQTDATPDETGDAHV